MMRMAMSPAAAGLLRSLLGRAGVNRDRILLTEFRSTDWQSLTFIGEQHKIRLRIPAPDAQQVASVLVHGLEDDEFSIRGHVVADVGLVGEPEHNADGSITLVIEALTVEE
jgi:hypothetical protein